MTASALSGVTLLSVCFNSRLLCKYTSSLPAAMHRYYASVTFYK